MTKFPIYRSIGRNIKKARLAAGMTQKQLGASVGLSREGVASIEQGRSAVKVHQLLEISGVLGMRGGGLEKAGHQKQPQRTDLAKILTILENDSSRFRSAAKQHPQSDYADLARLYDVAAGMIRGTV